MAGGNGEDRYAYEKTAVDPYNASEKQSEASQFRAIRGGSWYTGPLQARPSGRALFDEPDAAAYLGFRVVREAQEQTAPDFERELKAWEMLKSLGVGIFDRDSDKRYEAVVNSEGFRADQFSLFAEIGGISSLEFSDKAEVSVEEMAAIANMPELETLRFANRPDITPSDLKHLGKLARLRHLDLPRTLSMTDEGLVGLSELTSLEEISLFGLGGQLTDDGVLKLAGNRGLKRLAVYDSAVTGSFLRGFEGIPLEILALSGDSQFGIALTDENAGYLNQFPALQELNLQTARLGARGIAAISELTKLRKITLTGCIELSDKDLANLGKLERLHQLYLRDTNVGDQTLRAMKHLDNLITLELGSPNLTDAGMESLSRLMSLEYLTIRESNQVTDRGVSELRRLRRLKQLRLPFKPNSRRQHGGSVRHAQSG